MRVSTSSETIVIRCSRVSTFTRIVWFLAAAVVSPSAASGLLGPRRLGPLGFDGLVPGGPASLRPRAARTAAGAGRRRTGGRRGGNPTRPVPGPTGRRPPDPSRDTSPGFSSRTTGSGSTGSGGGAAASGSRPLGHALQGGDQVVVRARGLRAGGFQIGQDRLEPVQRQENQGDRGRGGGHAVAEPAHQGFGGVRQGFEARKAEEPAGSLDRMHQSEDVPQDRLVIRILLEPNKFCIDRVEMLPALGQKLAKQVVHRRYSLRREGLAQRTYSREVREAFPSRPRAAVFQDLYASAVSEASPRAPQVCDHCGRGRDRHLISPRWRIAHPWRRPAPRGRRRTAGCRGRRRCRSRGCRPSAPPRGGECGRASPWP